MNESTSEAIEVEEFSVDKGGANEDTGPNLLEEKRERERMSRQIAFGEGL